MGVGGVGMASAQPAPASPPGSNDFSCRPSAAHPRPVVLVHGTWSDRAGTWKTLSPALADAGYCVFAVSYGQHQPGSTDNLLNMFGGNSIERSAHDLAAFVDRVRMRTGARQVDIVGHSQGAVVTRQYLRFAGGTDAKAPWRNIVHTVVSLAGTNHGTTFNRNQAIGAIGQMLGIPVITLAATAVGPSYVEQMVGSPVLMRLNAGGDTRPGVRYVVVGTRDDNVVTPAATTFLRAGPGATVDNVWVQTGCPSARVNHMEVTTDPRAVGLVLRGLDPANATAIPLPCR
ncbi:alpha/beta fold hydrolase [Williamsia sp. CHRR-6]|nr:alpha/beta fold hydrolase [Williamsia sp. CHRR-6]